MISRLAPWLLVVTAACSSTPSSSTPPTASSDVAISSPTASPTTTTTTSPPATAPAGSSTPAGPTSAETACKADADCVFVLTSCCDVCNGGSQVAVNSSSADAVKARTRGKLDCEHRACTMRACLNPPKPVCTAGTCSSSP